MDKRYFSDKIVKWYQSNKRDLPWRQTKDPYKIWLSEIILQQTRVSQGLPYYEHFIDHYPTVQSLAKASEQDVLRLWQGLGYYSRARNLHKCAKTISENYRGVFPVSYHELLLLPGIGEYTAAAISSIAAGEPVAVVDGNVFRVLSRVFGLDLPINSPDGKRKFTVLANELIDKQHPDIHNQAVMEFGALFCTPKNPKCGECTFQSSCFAFARDLQSELPVKLKMKASRKRYFYYVVLEQANRLAMRKREGKDIWEGLFDFHLIEKKQPVKADKLLLEKDFKKLVKTKEEIKISGKYKHILSHQTIFSTFIIVKSKKNPGYSKKSGPFYSLKQISRLPKPVLISRFLSDHYLL
jgi:A/G-specific adenine glycosylase